MPRAWLQATPSKCHMEPLLFFKLFWLYHVVSTIGNCSSRPHWAPLFCCFVEFLGDVAPHSENKSNCACHYVELCKGQGGKTRGSSTWLPHAVRQALLRNANKGVTICYHHEPCWSNLSSYPLISYGYISFFGSRELHVHAAGAPSRICGEAGTFIPLAVKVECLTGKIMINLCSVCSQLGWIPHVWNFADKPKWDVGSGKLKNLQTQVSDLVGNADLQTMQFTSYWDWMNVGSANDMLFYQYSWTETMHLSLGVLHIPSYPSGWWHYLCEKGEYP